jgi:Domain of unknown function (DUF5664)
MNCRWCGISLEHYGQSSAYICPGCGAFDFSEEKETQQMDGEIIEIGGAQGTKLEEAWNLIPHSALAAIARRFWLGARKYAPRQWESGNEEFAEARLAHCYRHMALFSEYHRQEDLDAVLCNAAMLAHFKQRGMLKERP